MSNDATEALLIGVAVWVVSLWVFYQIIKAAVKNGIVEAGAENGPHHYVYADIRHDRSAEFETTPPVPNRSDETPGQTPG